MSLEIQPPELGFKRPFNREVCQILHLQNDNKEAVAFKVKTTAPKHYCVRPNSGMIEPGTHVEVQVLLQAMKDEPALDAKCKDKFLVQSVAVTGDLEFSNVTSIFEKSAKGSIQERKIRVNWLSADAEAEHDGEANGTTNADEAPPAYSTSPGAANFETPAVGVPKKTADATPIPPPDFTESSKKERSLTPPSTENNTTTSTFAAAASSLRSTVASAIPTSGEELKAQLAEANAQIQRLKDKLADQGLRQRKVPGETTTGGSVAPTSMQQQHQAPTVETGVSVPMVAALCLLSFLIAYFFF